MNRLIRILAVSLVASLFALAGVTYAQDASPSLLTYALAPDSAGVVQVYQQLLDANQSPRQITHAADDVLSFGVAYDGTGIAYISGGELRLQPTSTIEFEVLAHLSAVDTAASPVFSLDGQYLAYADHGVWLLDLGTRQTRQLLKDSPTAQYHPRQFLLGQAGKIPDLILDVTSR